MEVVLTHDWLTGFRGGERVLEVFCEIFPKAPIYTLIHEKGTTSDIIEDRKIYTSELQNIPGIFKNYRKFLPFYPFAVERMNLRSPSKLMLSSSHCVIKGLTKAPGSTHISYVHSPMRYIYDQFQNYFGDAKLIEKVAAHGVRPYLKYWDYKTNANVDHFIANAEFVKQRIETFYHREASVIHPFVDLKDFDFKEEEKENYYLMVTAFAPNKRVDLAVEAFNKLGLPLKIVGSGQQEQKLRKMAADNIEFLGHVSREEIVRLMKKATCFVFPGVEDFGITPLEALASGTPIIAFKAGGVLETLNDDVAHFFNTPTIDGLETAVREFSTREFYFQKLINRAKQFSKESFREKIELFIEQNMK